MSEVNAHHPLFKNFAVTEHIYNYEIVEGKSEIMAASKRIKSDKSKITSLHHNNKQKGNSKHLKVEKKNVFDATLKMSKNDLNENKITSDDLGVSENFSEKKTDEDKVKSLEKEKKGIFGKIKDIFKFK